MVIDKKEYIYSFDDKLEVRLVFDEYGQKTEDELEGKIKKRLGYNDKDQQQLVKYQTFQGRETLGVVQYFYRSMKEFKRLGMGEELLAILWTSSTEQRMVARDGDKRREYIFNRNIEKALLSDV